MAAGKAVRHWDAVYATHGADHVSWAQRDPGPSLTALDTLEVDRTDAVIDVGGGTSAFASALAERGFTDITVLDLSLEAINAGINRYGAHPITWQLGDVLDWRAKREYGLWHDRAVFHFLTDAPDRQRYRDVLNAALAPGGAIIIETFAPDGPDRCSGLPVARYSPTSLAHELGPGLALVASGDYEHQTPSGAIQAFIWLALRKHSRDSPPRA
ncbi:MAG: class I SAM-dependent methyltransferase [Actinomycetota bacterium]|nr:class I SAM-dependent methyltransferase [Actinomycetota bacterium]